MSPSVLRAVASPATAGQSGVVVVNPDGTSIGGAGVYNATLPTLTNGASSPSQVDSRGALYVDELYKAAGEDLVNDVQKVEQRFSYATITTAATTVIKTGSGLIHSLNIIGGTLGAITVYDNTAGSGTVIIPTFTPTATLPCPTILLDESFATGLTIVTAAATIINIGYR